MTTATPTRSRRGSPQSADKRHARQDEFMATLADGVQALTTSDGWRRYLRAMSTLRTYSSGNSRISQTRESIRLLSRWSSGRVGLLDLSPSAGEAPDP